MRIGIISSEVVIRPNNAGDFGGFDTFGPTIPLACRIKDLPGADHIVIGESTHRQAAGAIVATNRRTAQIPGLTRPLEVWDLEDLPEPTARFHAARRRGLTPFIGREEDSYLIRQAARRAAQGRGRRGGSGRRTRRRQISPGARVRLGNCRRRVAGVRNWRQLLR